MTVQYECQRRTKEFASDRRRTYLVVPNGAESRVRLPMFVMVVLLANVGIWLIALNTGGFCIGFA